MECRGAIIPICIPVPLSLVLHFLLHRDNTFIISIFRNLFLMGSNTYIFSKNAFSLPMAINVPTFVFFYFIYPILSRM